MQLLRRFVEVRRAYDYKQNTCIAPVVRVRNTGIEGHVRNETTRGRKVWSASGKQGNNGGGK